MARKMKLDFTGVESFERAPEGKHNCKIVSADVKQSQGGNDMIVVAFEVIKGEGKGARVYENYPLVDTALWKLKGLLQAIGMKADGKVQLDLDKLIGKICVVNVIHEEYEGKIRARVESVSKITAESADDSDDDEDESTEVEDEDDSDESEDEDEEEEEEKPTKKSAKKAPAKKEVKKPAKKSEPEEDEDDDDDDWDDDEDEEEEKPAPKKKAAKKPEKKATKKAKAAEEDDEDDDDDDDWDEE